MNPLYDYVFWIGNREFPSWQDDAQGKIYRSDSERAWDFVHQLEDGKLDFPFTQEQYLANEPVIRSLRAMDIELDKFWYAMLFVYDLVRERTEGVMQVPLSDFDQLRAFIKYMIDHPHAKLKVWEGRSHGVTVDSSLTIKCIRDILTHNSGKFCDTLSMSSLLAMGDFSENLSNVYKITFAIKCFLPLLQHFKTEDKRSSVPQKVSFNRMLLISRIVYFFGYTHNAKFLESDEGIKGIWTSNKDRNWDTVGKNFQ